MKLIVMIFMLVGLLIPSNINAQNTTSLPDSTITMSYEQYIQLKLDIQTLLSTDSLNNEIMLQQKEEINFLNLIRREDSLLMQYKEFRIELLEDEIGLYKDKLDDLGDTSWKDSKGVWATLGASAIILASWVVKNIGGG